MAVAADVYKEDKKMSSMLDIETDYLRDLTDKTDNEEIKKALRMAAETIESLRSEIRGHRKERASNEAL